MEDLIQEGEAQVLLALYEFDPERENASLPGLVKMSLINLYHHILKLDSKRVESAPTLRELVNEGVAGHYPSPERMAIIKQGVDALDIIAPEIIDILRTEIGWPKALLYTYNQQEALKSKKNRSTNLPKSLIESFFKINRDKLWALYYYITEDKGPVPNLLTLKLIRNGGNVKMANRKELLEYAKELGFKVPKKTTDDQLSKLIIQKANTIPESKEKAKKGYDGPVWTDLSEKGCQAFVNAANEVANKAKGGQKQKKTKLPEKEKKAKASPKAKAEPGAHAINQIKSIKKKMVESKMPYQEGSNSDAIWRATKDTKSKKGQDKEAIVKKSTTIIGKEKIKCSNIPARVNTVLKTLLEANVIKEDDGMFTVA